MKTLKIKNKEDFLKKAEKVGLNVSDWSKELLDKVDYTKSDNYEVVIKTVAELGFTGWTKYRDILAKAEELGYEKLYHTQALTFALEYKPDRVVIVTESIADRHGDPLVFSLGRRDDGLWLSRIWAEPDHGWYPDNAFVFRLRKALNPSETSLGNFETFESLSLPKTLVINGVKYKKI